MGVKQQTWVVGKFLDDSLMIKHRNWKPYKGQRISVEEFGAIPLGDFQEYMKNRQWRLAAKTTKQTCILFQQTGDIRTLVNLTRKLNSRLKRKSA